MKYKKHNLIYKPFHQLPFCCVPATLQWVLYRRKIDIMDQETIGVALGLRIPKKFSKFFQNKKIKFIVNKSSEAGTQILKSRYSIGNFLKKFNIPLKISHLYNFKKEEDLKKFLLKNLKNRNDIILRYNNKIFKSKKYSGFGHFGVIADFKEKSKKVLIGDPEPPFFKETSLKKLLFAVSNKIDGIERGFFIIS